MQFATDVRNARADAVETTIGTAPTLEIRTGAAPATPATADSGTLLATVTLPSDWLAAAASGVKAMSGSWVDSDADGTGEAGHFRIKVAGVCKIQGDVTGEGLGGDMEVDDVDFAPGKQFSVTTFQWTEGNA